MVVTALRRAAREEEEVGGCKRLDSIATEIPVFIEGVPDGLSTRAGEETVVGEHRRPPPQREPWLPVARVVVGDAVPSDDLGPVHDHGGATLGAHSRAPTSGV